MSQSIAIKAVRDLSENDDTIIFDKMSTIVADNNVRQLIFGGSRGGDTVALFAALHLRDDVFKRTEDLNLVVVLPCKIINQPVEAQSAIRCANEIIELNKQIKPENDWFAFKNCNREMVLKASKVIGFWDCKSKESGTYDCMKTAIELKRPVEVVKLGVEKEE
jgi:hypothetical protein